MPGKLHIVTPHNIDDKIPSDVEELLFQLPDAEELPQTVNWGSFTSLQHLDLSHCSSLQQLPAAICSISSLRSLSFGGSSHDAPACWLLTALPASIGSLAGLQVLNLCGCRSLTTLPGSIGKLQALKQLHMSGCSALQQLPDSLCGLGALQELRLNCSPLQQLPQCLGDLRALQHLDLSCSSSLKQLPESLGRLGSLRVLDLRGCSSLQQLPSSVGCCVSLEALQLAGCAALTSLPPSIGNCKKLQELSVQDCSRLKQLPRSSSKLTALQHFEYDGCPACAGLSQRSGNVSKLDEVPTPSHHSLGDSSRQGSAAAGFERSCCLSSTCLGWHCRKQQRQQPGVPPGLQLVQSALMLQRHRNAVVKLATQQEPMLTTLERMSWLVVLLATATFVAFTMPPGGYGDNQQVLSSHTAACGAGEQLGVDADGLSSSALQQCAMLLFFVFDGLSFGLSLGCVMMIVVLSMPRIQWESEKAEAGRFYLLLSVTWFLLYAAVATGFASFIAAGLSVNRQVKVVIGPVVPGMFLLVVGGVLLCYRFWCLAPGWDAILSSLSFHNQEVKDVCEVERGQELFWRYWGDKLSRNGLGSSATAAAASDDVELQRLLPPEAAAPGLQSWAKTPQQPHTQHCAGGSTQPHAHAQRANGEVHRSGHTV